MTSMADLESARRWLAGAERIAVLTGAGISAESGVPIFRGPGGLWRQYRPEDLATPGAFARDPRLVWEWYDWRRSVVAQAEPNAGHLALAELERRTKDFTLITQNVDGLHERAGSRRVLKLHGDLWTLRCTGCGAERVDGTVPLPELPPRCALRLRSGQACGGLLRPGVVWFGESLPADALEQAMAAAAGARVVEINAEPTPLTDLVDASFLGKSGELLPRLVEAGVRA